MLSHHQYEVITGHLEAGRLIMAVRDVRQYLGIGLKEAKELAEAIRDERLSFADLKERLGHRDLPSLPKPLHEESVRELVMAGRKIQAIKAYREQTGLGLKEAKDAIDAMSAELNDQRPSTSKTANEEVRALVRAGHKIEAIKVYREQTGLGLKEAKDAIEAMAEDER